MKQAIRWLVTIALAGIATAIVAPMLHMGWMETAVFAIFATIFLSQALRPFWQPVPVNGRKQEGNNG